MKTKRKIIGLIGGMGPFASAYFYNLLLNKSVADYGASDNDSFPEIILDSVPVPDFISDTDKVGIARHMLLERVKKLKKYGATDIAMVCNTGHLLYSDLAQVFPEGFHSMIRLIAKEANTMGVKKIGILATSTTIKFDLYGEAMAEYGIEVVYPNAKTQLLHTKVIRSVVGGYQDNRLINDLYTSTKKFVKENHLDTLVLGCTELPLVFPKNKFKIVILDSLEILANNLLKRYYE